MPIAEDILEWAETRPAWQRDALRRLVHTPDLTDEDIDQLSELCKAPFVDAGSEIEPQPVSATDLANLRPDSETGAVLLEIADVQNVNAIASDTPLRFSPSGLTVIYGANGAGKSGYVRMLKQVCRARGQRPAVLPNVYRAGERASASAKYRYVADGTEHEIEWQGGEEGPEELRTISIFDHDCASVYTDEACEVAFLPGGLDLLQRLTDVMTEVRRQLDGEIAQLEERALILPEVPEGTAAEEVLDQLDQDGAADLINDLSRFGDAEHQRLAELESFLAEQDPTARAAELTARANRIETGTRRITDLVECLSEDRIAELREALRNREATKEALTVATNEAFSSEPLEGTGGEIWRALWEAARRFNDQQAGEGEPSLYPPLRDEPCLLCQQPLNGEAAGRLQRFEEFVRSDVERQADDALHRLEECRELVNRAPLPGEDEVVPDVELSDEALAQTVRELLASLGETREAALAANQPQVLEGYEVPGHDDVTERLQVLVDDLRARSADLRSAAQAETRQALIHERDELLGRSKLAERKPDLLGEVRRRTELRARQEARRTTTTTGVTRKNSELTQQYLTEELSLSFTDTVRALRLEHLPIHVAGAPGDTGTAYHRLRLEAQGDAEVVPGHILSRGEHRAIAIAAFLAEITTQDGESAIILDDPVSSLDHDRRSVVAERLVGVAESRPVVVFTHDMAFALALQKQSDQAGVELSMSRLLRRGAATGRVAEDLPWHGMNVKRRLGHLRQLHQQAGAAYRRGDQEDYERRVKEIYGFLREAWERAVEEVLLNGAVERFSPEIQTMRLRNLAGLSDGHLEQLEAGMTKTSRWLRGHDDAAPVNDPVPDPDEVEADIAALDVWRGEVKRIHQR